MKPRKQCRATLAVFLAFALPAAAFAAENEVDLADEVGVQDEAAKPAGTEPGKDVEEIVVSVRKTDEDLQQVPIAVAVFTSEQIERERIRTLADVALQSPNIQFDTGFWPSDTRVSIRGLFARAGRPSAGILIDGIDASSESLLSAGGSALLNQRVLNLERIEIARGPQSALYGRTAFSGAINYVTKRPDPEWSSSVSVDAAQGGSSDEGRYDVQAVVEGPITDELAFGLLGSFYDLDGWYENSVNGDQVGGGKSYGTGFALNWKPSDVFSAYLNTTYSDDKFDPQPVVLVRADKLRKLDGANGNALVEDAEICDRAAGDECLAVVTGTIKAQESDINLPPKASSFDVDGLPRDPSNSSNYDGTKDKTWRTSLILDWDLDWGQLKSSTAYTNATNRIYLDTSQGDGIPATGQPGDSPLFGTLGNYTDGDFKFKFKQYYQEFQISNPDSDGFDWLAGVNAFYEDGESGNNAAVWYRDDTLCQFGVVAGGCDLLPTSPFPTTRFAKTQERDSTSLSVFGLLGLDLSETVKLTLESRVIYDKVEVKGSTSDLLQDILDPAVGSYRNLPGFADDIDDTNILPRAALDWQYTDDLMFYTSVAKGIKPPSFNSADLRDPERQKIKREKLWTYEVGSKAQFFERDLTVNTAVYYNDYTDQQTRISGNDPDLNIPIAASTNAGEVHTWGVELDTTWTPTDNWLFNFNYAYADASYDSFNVSEATEAAGLVSSSSEAVKAGNIDAIYDGNDIPGIPEHSFNLIGSYQDELTAELGWYTQASWQWQDERYADTANLVTLDSYSVVNAQIGLRAERWEAVLYTENIFDDDTVRFAQEFIDQTQGFQLNTLSFPVAYLANLPQPRTVGVRFVYRTP